MEKREHKPTALAMGTIALSLSLAAGCSTERGPVVGQSGSEGVPDKDQAPQVGDISSSSFRVVDLGMPTCSDERDLTSVRISPAPAALEAQLGSGSAEFVVLMKHEVSLSEFPLEPGNRDDPTPTPAQTARALEIAKWQVCALEEVSQAGGEYLSSFWLINAFSAELTAELAIRLSQRADVQSVELSQTGARPTGG